MEGYTWEAERIQGQFLVPSPACSGQKIRNWPAAPESGHGSWLQTSAPLSWMDPWATSSHHREFRGVAARTELPWASKLQNPRRKHYTWAKSKFLKAFFTGDSPFGITWQTQPPNGPDEGKASWRQMGPTWYHPEALYCQESSTWRLAWGWQLSSQKTFKRLLSASM